MANGVTVTIDKTKLIEQATAFLTANKVYVGISSSDAMVDAVAEVPSFDPVTGKKNANASAARGPVNLAVIGYVLENGSPVNNIPARPHLVPGVEAVQDSIASRFKQAGQTALSGNLPLVDKYLRAAGDVATTSVVAMINSNIQPALSERTLAARLARGRTGTNTLVDIGNYRGAMKYFIDDGQHRTLGDDTGGDT